MELCQSTTKENLLRAFAGESQARNRYDFAAQACKEKKLYVLEALFKYTAGQEKEHAEIFYNHLVKGGCENVTITANYPVDLTQEPLKLLELAQQHELDEFGDIYPAFAEKAQEEGFAEAARHFRQIAGIEKVHAQADGGGQALRQQCGDGVDVPQLRPCALRHQGSGQMPRLRP